MLKNKVSVKILTILTILSIVFVSQGIIVCHEGEKNYNIEFKFSPCNIAKENIPVKENSNVPSSIKVKSCTDFEFNLIFNVRDSLTKLKTFLTTAIVVNSQKYSFLKFASFNLKNTIKLNDFYGQKFIDYLLTVILII